MDNLIDFILENPAAIVTIVNHPVGETGERSAVFFFEREGSRWMECLPHPSNRELPRREWTLTNGGSITEFMDDLVAQQKAAGIEVSAETASCQACGARKRQLC